MRVKSLPVNKPTTELFSKKEKSKANALIFKKKIAACISKGLKDEDILSGSKPVKIKTAGKKGTDKSDNVEESLRAALKEKFFSNIELNESAKELNGDGDHPRQSGGDQDDDHSEEDQLFDSQMDMTEPSGPNSKLTKSQRKRQKKREIVKLKRAAKTAIPKPEPKEPPTSSNIVLPPIKRFVSELDTDEKRLKAACARLVEMNNFVLQIRPIPRTCPPGLVKDLCPLATGIRFPAKPGAHYVFVQFRNNEELVATQNYLTDKTINGKPIKVVRATSEVIPNKSKSGEWRQSHERQLSDFKWNVLYVTHLPRATTRFDLAQVFRKATSVHMPTFDDGSCKGFCTLTYQTKKAASHAFETRHGTFVRGSSIHVNFALKNKLKPSKKPTNKRPLDDNESKMETSDAGSASKIACTEDSKPSPKKKSPKQSLDTFDPAFVIQSSAETESPSLSKKKSKVATNLPSKSDPKLTSKHQLKYKGMTKQSSTSSALDALLKPSASSSSSSKKTKKDRSNSKNQKFKRR